MRILQIDNDIVVTSSVATLLRAHELTVDTADDLEEGIYLADTYDADLVLVYDIDQIKAVRGKLDLPLILLTEHSDVRTKARALTDGADDCLVRPFHIDELVARINAIVRRFRGHAQSKIRHGDLEININTRDIHAGGQAVRLTRKEYQLLEMLLLRRGRAVSKEVLFNNLYGGRDEPELKIIDVFICKLRNKLKSILGGCQPIETVWGFGYMLGEKSFQKERNVWRHAS